MAKTPDLHVIIDVDPSKLHDALTELEAARARYEELLSGARNCPAVWPADPPGEDYLGTRCDLLRHHEGQHRHRMLGSNVTVEWN